LTAKRDLVGAGEKLWRYAGEYYKFFQSGQHCFMRGIIKAGEELLKHANKQIKSRAFKLRLIHAKS
jgi:hypothetical protein